MNPLMCYKTAKYIYENRSKLELADLIAKLDLPPKIHAEIAYVMNDFEKLKQLLEKLSLNEQQVYQQLIDLINMTPREYEEKQRNQKFAIPEPIAPVFDEKVADPEQKYANLEKYAKIQQKQTAKANVDGLPSKVTKEAVLERVQRPTEQFFRQNPAFYIEWCVTNKKLHDANVDFIKQLGAPDHPLIFQYFCLFDQKTQLELLDRFMPRFSVHELRQLSLPFEVISSQWLNLIKQEITFRNREDFRADAPKFEQLEFALALADDCERLLNHEQPTAFKAVISKSGSFPREIASWFANESKSVFSIQQFYNLVSWVQSPLQLMKIILSLGNEGLNLKQSMADEMKQLKTRLTERIPTTTKTLSVIQDELDPTYFTCVGDCFSKLKITVANVDSQNLALFQKDMTPEFIRGLEVIGQVTEFEPKSTTFYQKFHIQPQHLADFIVQFTVDEINEAFVVQFDKPMIIQQQDYVNEKGIQNIQFVLQQQVIQVEITNIQQLENRVWLKEGKYSCAGELSHDLIVAYKVPQFKPQTYKDSIVIKQENNNEQFTRLKTTQLQNPEPLLVFETNEEMLLKMQKVEFTIMTFVRFQNCSEYIRLDEPLNGVLKVEQQLTNGEIKTVTYEGDQLQQILKTGKMTVQLMSGLQQISASFTFEFESRVFAAKKIIKMLQSAQSALFRCYFNELGDSIFVTVRNLLNKKIIEPVTISYNHQAAYLCQVISCWPNEKNQVEVQKIEGLQSITVGVLGQSVFYQVQKNPEKPLQVKDEDDAKQQLLQMLQIPYIRLFENQRLIFVGSPADMKIKLNNKYNYKVQGVFRSSLSKQLTIYEEKDYKYVFGSNIQAFPKQKPLFVLQKESNHSNFRFPVVDQLKVNINSSNHLFGFKFEAQKQKIFPEYQGALALDAPILQQNPVQTNPVNDIGGVGGRNDSRKADRMYDGELEQERQKHEVIRWTSGIVQEYENEGKMDIIGKCTVYSNGQVLIE